MTLDSFICGYCENSLPDHGSLINHIETEHEEKKNQIRNKISEAHNDNQNHRKSQNFRCEPCSETFQDEQALSSHIKSKHKLGNLQVSIIMN